MLPIGLVTSYIGLQARCNAYDTLIYMFECDSSQRVACICTATTCITDIKNKQVARRIGARTMPSIETCFFVFTTMVVREGTPIVRCRRGLRHALTGIHNKRNCNLSTTIRDLDAITDKNESRRVTPCLTKLCHATCRNSHKHVDAHKAISRRNQKRTDSAVISTTDGKTPAPTDIRHVSASPPANKA